MSVTDSATVVIPAPLEQVLAFLRDIEHQRDWFPGNSVSEPLEHDAEGRVTRARMVNDVKVAKDEFVLDYTHSDHGFSWILTAPTLVQKAQTGSWVLRERGGQTEATMTVVLDTKLPLPGFVQKRVASGVVKGTTAALAKQF